VAEQDAGGLLRPFITGEDDPRRQRQAIINKTLPDKYNACNKACGSIFNQTYKNRKMKRVFWGVLTIFLFAVACKKDDDVVKNNPGRLQGRWEAVKNIVVHYVNDREVDRDTADYDPNDQVFEFRGDSLFLYRDGDPSGSYRYTIEGNELIARQGSGGYFFTLKWYHDNQMGLVQEETSVSSSGERRRSIDEIVFNRKQ